MRKINQWVAAASMTALVFSGIAGDWPQWGGPNRDHISKEAGLLQKWPEGGPKRIWLSEKGGVGYAGFSVVEGQLFTMGARDGKEQLLAFGANDGKELWAADLGDILKNDWGDGPRGTPTVDGDRVYALGGKGKLVAASVKDGKILWTKSLTADLGGKVPGWGYTESVLVEGGVVYCTPGGSKGTIAALDKMTGELKWQSSEVTTDLNGSRQLIQLTEKQLTSVNVKDGKLLWKSPWPGRTAVIPTPVVSGNQVYITTGYGVGSKLVKVDAGNKPSDVFENKVMKNHHGGVVLLGGHIYGYSDGPGWVCQDFQTGKEVWADKKLDKGAVTYAGGRLYCLEEGMIWTHPVIANGKLYLRDQELIFCFDVSSK
jgi:outer membrane protein assembly factor BamB